jgi:hypothetical protein
LAYLGNRFDIGYNQTHVTITLHVQGTPLALTISGGAGQSLPLNTPVVYVNNGVAKISAK